MAFFDLPAEETLSPDVRRMMGDMRRALGADTVPPSWQVYGRSPKLLEARLTAYRNLNLQCGFSWEARMVAVMLIAHAKRCRTCFGLSRAQLMRLGFDESALDAMCANPDTLALTPRDRRFVEYALRIATGSADLQPKDFREMAAHGFSRDEVQEIIGFVAYWVMNMIFSQAALAALADD